MGIIVHILSSRNGMASWKLSVENYGKIKSAEIEVAPLTLFVGDNNSGKSYLLALLWGIEKFGVEALIGEDYINTDEANELINWIGEQIEITIEKKHHEIPLGEIASLLNKFLNIELKKKKGNLVKRIFNSKSVEIGKLEIKLQNLKEDCLYFDLDENMGYLNLSDNTGPRFLFAWNIVTDELDRKSKFFYWYVIKVIYSVILNIDIQEILINNCIYLPAARTGFMLTKDIINKVGRKNTFNLPDEKETITPFIRPINEFLDIMGDLSVDNFGKDENVKLASDLEKEMTNGTIEFSAMPNKEVQYIPTGYKKGIPLRLSSAVVTELSPFILILKHHNYINRFYYEEPEMCLHPQLQSKMGKMIGRIVNSNIGMVITTHSDIILQHINNMIKLSKREDNKDICDKLGYTKLDLLDDSQVKIYQFRAKIREKTEVEELICGEDGFIVPTFNDALDEIMDEAYEIQG